MPVPANRAHYGNVALLLSASSRYFQRRVRRDLRTLHLGIPGEVARRLFREPQSLFESAGHKLQHFCGEYKVRMQSPRLDAAVSAATSATFRQSNRARAEAEQERIVSLRPHFGLRASDRC